MLRDISFSVQKGERVGILGANGAGKSTLLWCILGLHKPVGRVRLFGEKPNRRIWKRVGVVFQNPEDLLFMPALIDDLTLPLLNRGVDARQARQQARDLLDRMGLADYENEPAEHLSLGQRKRAAIAAALAISPELLILDEPTAELDQRSVRRLSEHVQCLPVTSLVTSHNLDYVRHTTQRLLVLHGGTLIADGATPDILRDTGLLDRAELI